MIYRVNGIRLRQPKKSVDLGYGLKADMFSVVDDQLLVTWDWLQWIWTDDHVGHASSSWRSTTTRKRPFPQPTGGCYDAELDVHRAVPGQRRAPTRTRR